MNKTLDNQKQLCYNCKSRTNFYEIVNETGFFQGKECGTCGHMESGNSSFDKIFNSYVYEKECPICARKLEVLTQRDDSPEYYTNVQVFCSCGEPVMFELPVN